VSKERIAAHINELDGYKCRGCGKGVVGRMPHHIIYRSQISIKNGRDEDWNLITLCMDCDHDVHHGTGSGANRVPGRKVMLNILKKLDHVVGHRWGRAYQQLRRKV